MLRKWASLAGDPDAELVSDWLSGGAPAGIDKVVADPGQVFPERGQGEDDALQQGGADFAWRDPASHENYTSVDNDPNAGPEVDRILRSGFVKVFEDLDKCRQYLQGEPVTSKLAMISKLRPDGTTKRRLILDCRESQVNDRAARGGRLTQRFQKPLNPGTALN